MDIITLIKNENKRTQQRWNKLMSDQSFRMDDWRSQLEWMVWDVLATEEAKAKVVYSSLRRENANPIELQEVETLSSQLQGALLKLHEMDRLDLRWDGWQATASNIMRTKMAFEDQLLEEVDGIFDGATKAKMATIFERCRREGPQTVQFHDHDAPVIKNRNFAS